MRDRHEVITNTDRNLHTSWLTVSPL